MTPDNLIDLAHRKNAAHKDFLEIRGRLRGHGGSEKDRDVAMDHASREKREIYENLCDEWTVRLMEYEHDSKAA